MMTAGSIVSRRAEHFVFSALFFALFATLMAATPALASGEDDPATGWSFSLGVFDVSKYQNTAEAGIEYRWQPFELWRLELRPTFGLTGTADGGFWAYAGLRWDVPVGNSRFVPSLAFAVVGYEQGDGKDLGGVLQFRSALDLAYRLDSGSRIGLSIYHLSNASIHDFNPGSESLVLFWSPGR